MLFLIPGERVALLTENGTESWCERLPRLSKVILSSLEEGCGVSLRGRPLVDPRTASAKTGGEHGAIPDVAHAGIYLDAPLGSLQKIFQLVAIRF